MVLLLALMLVVHSKKNCCKSRVLHCIFELAVQFNFLYRKLKAAKENLKRLQSLVAMVQGSPDMADSLGDNLAELAASLDGGDSQEDEGENRNNASTSEGEVPTAQQSER